MEYAEVLRRVRSGNNLTILLPFKEVQAELDYSLKNRRETQYLTKAGQKVVQIGTFNWVETVPLTSDPINTTNTTNVSQSAIDENIHQLLDSKGGSHVINVPAFKKRILQVGKLDDEGVTMIRAFMAISKDEPSVGKVDTRSGQYVDITMKKVYRLLSMTADDERKHLLDYTHVDLHYVEDQRKNLVNKFNLLKQKISLHKSELSNPKNTMSINGSFQNEIIKEPLPLLPKLIGVIPFGISMSLVSLFDLTLNMSDLTLDSFVPKKTRPSTKVSLKYVIKKKTKKYSVVPKPCSDNKTNTSTKQLLLTLMEEAAVKKSLSKLKAQSPLKSTQKKTLMIPKPFKECKYCGFNDHHSDHCEFYLGCEDYLKRSIWYLDSGCSRHMTWIKQYLHKYSKEPGPKVVFKDDSSRDTKGYGSMNCNEITFTRVAYVDGLKHNLISISQLCDANYKVLFTKTQGIIYNQNNEVVLIALRRRDVYVIDMLSFNKESNDCFFAKASSSVNWLWNKRLSHINFKNINNLAKHNLVSGLPFLTFSKDKNYSDCEKEKHQRASFKTKRSFSINKSLHLFHMDLFRHAKPQTISPNKYTFVIIDVLKLKLSGCSTSEDKKWKKQCMLHSMKMMKPFLNPTQKTKMKRIPPSSKPKSPHKVRVILPKKQVAKTQLANVTVATANATKSLIASELAEEQANQPSATKAEKVSDLRPPNQIRHDIYSFIGIPVGSERYLPG
nr:retrovirus-related Pol polyprotein from transposon TNT 1-94 [Tanacetum cinerariifolium]